jgi:hypothetical protein
LLKSIDFKQCSQREKIVTLGEKVEYIYFVSGQIETTAVEVKLALFGTDGDIEGLIHI